MEQILSSIINNENLLADLNTLNDLIRGDESLRKQTPVLFYSVMRKLLVERTDTKILEMSIKCLKNSSAAFSTKELNSDEIEIFNLLLSYLNENLDDSEKRASIFILIMQYFFNLSQGNEKVLNLLSNELFSICFKIINIQNEDFIDLASMIIVNIISKDDSYIEQYINSFEQFSSLTKRVLNTNNDPTDQDWTLKLINQIYDKFYLNSASFYNELSRLNLEQRYNLLKMIRFKLNSDETHLSFECLCYLIKQYEISTADLIDLVQRNSLDEMQLINDYLKEINILAHCLSELLISENKSFIDYAQNNQILFKNTCDLFKKMHENELLIKGFDLAKIDQLKFSCSFNLRIEMVRLIGILVYDNGINQQLLFEYGVLNLIANNLNIDMENLFAREWSIVALKHILDKLDMK